MQQALSDTELVKAAQRGEKGSFALLFERYEPSLYAAALKTLGHGAPARDAVQDTFLAALSKIGQLRKASAVKYWLHSILRNQCRMYFRRSRKMRSEEEIPERPSAPAISQKLEQLQQREAILQALASLPEKQRLPLMLRYFSHCPAYETIADILGVPIGTVRSRLSRAKKQLLEKFLDRARLENAGLHRAFRRRKEHYREAIREFYKGNRQKFMAPFREGLQLRFSSGKEERGLVRWALEWEEDLESGVRFLPGQILASGNLTIIEGAFRNPPHDPHHCPPAGVFVLFHRGQEVYRVHIHYGKPSC